MFDADQVHIFWCDDSARIECFYTKPAYFCVCEGLDSYLNMHETASKWVSCQFLVGCIESTEAGARNNVTERPEIVSTVDAEEPHTHNSRKIPTCLVVHQRGLLLTLRPHEHDPLVQFT